MIATKHNKTEIGNFILPGVGLMLALLLSSGSSAQAADTSTSAWNGSSTIWNSTGSWASGIPSSSISALFGPAFTGANQPTLAGAQMSQGIWLASSVGQDVTINSASAYALTISGNATLNGQANAGIIMSDSANHNLTIGPNTSITLGANTGFYNNEASGQLNISGNISGSSQTLTGGGTGIVNLSGGATLQNLVATNTGTLKLTAGTVSISGTSGGTSVDKNGTLEVDAGATLTLGSGTVFFPIGNTAGTTSSLFVNGGTVTMNGSSGTQVSRIGSGILTITNGGSFTDNGGNSKGIDIGDSTGTTGGTINLNGGTLTANLIRSAKGTGSSGAVPCFFYFNGGTLKANSSPATAFFSVSSAVSAQVRNGGGTVDNNGKAITIGQSLLHSAVGGDAATDGGLIFQGSGTNTLTGASTYTGPTAINGGVVNAGGAQTGTTSGPLGANGAISFGGGTLQYSSTFGAVDLSPRIAAGTSTGVISLDLNGQNVTFGTALTSSQSGGLTLNDTAVTKGSLTLSGANGYTGNTTVTAGNLILAASASLGSGTVSVNANSLTMNSGSSIGGALTMAGGLTFTAKGNDSVNGLLTLAAGATTVDLSADSAANTLTLGNGLTLNNNNVLNFDVATAGSDKINVTAGAYSDSAVLAGNKVQVNLTSIGTGLTAGGTIDLITLTGSASGTIDLTKFNLSPTTLNGLLLSLQTANSGKTLQLLVAAASSPASAFWDGAVNVSWGNLNNWATDVTGATALSVLPGGGVTTVNFSATTSANLSTTLNANYDIYGLAFNNTSGNVGIDVGSHTLTLEAPTAITLNSGAGSATISASGAGSYVLGLDQTIANESSSALTISAPISGAHNLTINSSGSGVTTLSGANSHGDTAVTTGELDLNTTGGQSIPGNLTVNGGTAKLLQVSQINSAKNVVVSSGTLNIQGNNQTVAGVQMTGGSIIGGAGTLTSTTAYDLQNGTASAILGGSAGLTKSTAGTVTLSGANTYTGPTAIQNGVLSVASINSVSGGNASSSLGAPTTVTNGTIAIGSTTTSGQLSYTGTGEASDRVIDLAGTTGGATIDQSGSGLLKFTSDFTSSGIGSKTLTLQGSGTGEVAGVVATNTGTSVVKAGSGTWTISGSGTSTPGNLAVNGGLLKITVGTINISGSVAGGTLVDKGSTLEVDAGGTLTIPYASSYFPIGNTSGTTNTLFVNGGTVNVNCLNGEQIGRVGSGILTISSGSLTDTSGTGKGLSFADSSATASGTVNLNGGTLTASVIRSPSGTGSSGLAPCIFYFNGGTLKAGAANATFFSTADKISAQVRNGGGTVDNNGNAITIGDNLVHSTVGADNATDGGMTFTDSGAAATTTLTGAETYTGNTIISGGTLALTGTASITNSANISIGTGANFDVTGLSSTFAIGSGQTLVGNGGTLVGSANLNLDVGALALNYANGTPSLIVTNGTLTLSSNAVIITVSGSALTAGSYQLIAAATGGSIAGILPANVTVNGSGATAPAVLQIVNGGLDLVVGTTTLALTSSENPSLVGDNVSFTASVQTNGVTAGDAAGTVTLFANSVSVATNNLSGGATSFSLSSLPVGVNPIMAIYSGDPNYLSSTNALTQTVTNSGVTAPLINGPTNLTVVAGTNATLSALVYGSPTPDLQWYLSTDGGATSSAIAGETSSSLALANVSYSQDGYIYSLVASNSAGMATNSVTLTVWVTASISSQPASLVVTNTQSAAFSVTASGVPAPTYQWYFNGNLISAATATTYNIASAVPTNTGNYTVVISNSVNVVTSSVATLTVNSTMGYTSLTPANGTTGVCYDTPLYLTFDQTPTLRTSGTIKIFNVNNSATPVDTIDMSQCVTNNATYAANVQPYTIGGQTFSNFPVIITGTTAAIYPHQGLLTSNQTYYVTVDDGTFTDSAGAWFAGITATNAWQFTTKIGGPLTATNLVVAQDYSGDFATVQGAVNFVPSGNTTPTIINIRDGTYTEIVNVNVRHDLDFRGQSRNGTIIGYPNNSYFNGGAPWRSCFVLNGNDCSLETLTVTNMTPKGGSQAEAIDVEGTRAIFYNINLASYQDTFLVHSAGKLVYFQNSLIQGDTDFNWGYGTVYYTNCELRCLTAGGRVTQPRSPYTTNGFGFINCRITKGYSGSSAFSLGRSIGTPSTPSEVLFATCLMDDVVTGYDADAGTNFSDYACSNLTATAAKTLVNSTHLTSSDPFAIAIQSAATWLYGWSPSLAPNILVNPVGQAATAGASVTFSVSATAIPAPAYQWLKGGVAIAGQTGSSLSLANVSAADAADYSVVVSNASGVVTSSVASLAVNKATPVLSLVAGAITYGQTLADSDLSASTATNTVNQAPVAGEFNFVLPSIAPGVGTTNIAVYFTPGDTASYNYVTNDVTVTVVKADSSVAVTGPTTFNYNGAGQGPANANVIGSSGPVSYSYSGAGYGPSTDVPTDAGSYTVTATVAADSNYNGASSSAASFTISAKAASVTADAKSKTYGDVNPGLTATEAGTVNGDTLSYSLATDATQFSGVGVSNIVVTLGNNPNYSVSATNSILTINAASLSITASNASKPYGQTVTFTGTEFFSSGLVGSDSVSSVTLNSSGAVSPAPAGSYDIVPSAATGIGLANYNINYSNGTLVVSQTNTFVGASSAENPSGYKDAVSFLATLPTDASGTVVFFSTNGAFSTNSLISGLATSLSLTNLPRGTNLITGIYSGDGNYFGSTNTMDQVVTNHPPVAGDATYYRAEGYTLKIYLTNLFTNVTDADGDSITLTDVGACTNSGATTLTNAAYIDYIPSTGANSNNNDSFTYTVDDGYGGSATANIYVNVYSTSNSAQISIPTNGVVNIKFFGIPTYTYVVQTTTNLSKPWWPINTNTAGSDGTLQFTDLNATNSQKYYRTVQQ